jgi:pimeloyl-ACP methyl ester carboxylesterase
MIASERPDATSATDLLLLPGLMCDQVFWQPLLDVLPPRLRGQVVDYGDADSLGAMAQVALDMAPARFALAGHSMGGRVAMELVRLAPQRVERLILMDTGYLPLAAGEAGDKERAGRLALVELARRQGVRAMAAEWTRGMVHPARLTDALLVGQITDMFEHKSAQVFARQQQALLARPDATPVLSGLAGLGLPTLLLCGRQDSWANLAQHEAMLGLAPKASLCVIEDAGHMVLMEQPQATRQAMLSFLLAPSG